MKKPSLEEVKEYFKDAETISPLSESYNLEKYTPTLNIVEYCSETKAYYSHCEEINTDCELWNKKKGYAKILTYKEPKEETFVISMEQIDCLCDKNEAIQELMREWFTSAFVEDKKELIKDFTGWVKTDKEKDGDWLMYFKKGFQKYGFDFEGTWTEYHTDILMEGDELEATPEEVKEALTKEAIKRGYVEGVWLKKAGSNKHMDQKLKICGNFDWFPSLNILDDQLGNGHIFDNGIWSEIIPTITKEEAEQKLNCKII